METDNPQDAALKDMGMGVEYQPEEDEKPEPADPVEPVEIVEPVEPDAPAEPTEPVEPTEPEKPAPEAETDKAPGDALTDADLEPPKRGEKSAERWQKLSDGYRKEHAARETLETQNSDYRESFKALQNMGYDSADAAQDLFEFSKYRKAIFAGDVDTFNAMVSQQIQQFEELHGKRPQIATGLIDKFPDLRQQVDDMEMTEETANELARSRSLQGRVTRERDNRNDARDQEQTKQRDMEAVTDGIATMQQAWAKTDPDYQAVLSVLQPKMGGIAADFPPAMWQTAIKREYASIKETLAGQARPGNNSQPLRGNGRASAVAVPSNPQNAALADMGMEWSDD